MKKLILLTMFLVVVMNPIKCIAKEFLVVNKGSAQETLNIIKQKKFTTLNVIALDNDKLGYVKIIYE